MTELIEKIEQLLLDKFQDSELAHLFIIEIKQLPSNKLQVFIDSDQALDLSHCAMISRYLEKHIEENAWMGESYTLDVSSPGLDAPLKSKRQYIKNIGREVSVGLKDNHKNVKGILQEVGEDTILIEYEEKISIDGKKKKKLVLMKKEIPFDNIQQTKVKITFK